MNFIRKFIGTSATDEVASIPSGKLFLTRSPQSPKGEMECLYIDAFACIRQTTRPFFFQLCITRVYQEGELVAHGSSGFDDSDEDDEDENDTPHSLSDATTGSKDEWTFSILEDLKIHSYTKTDGTRAITWNDLNGDIGDKFEFIVDEDVKLNDVDAFMLALHKCLYEVKYHRSSLGIKDLSELDEFIYTPKPELISIGDLKSSNILRYDSDEEDDDEDEEDVEEDPEDESDGENDFKDASGDSLSNFDTKLVEPKGITTYTNKEFELHFYDTVEQCFKLVGENSESVLKLINLGDWEYTLFVHTNKGTPVRFNATVSKNMNPTFNYEHLSFIFNYFAVEGTELLAYSWLLKFPSFNELSKFQNLFMGALWETLNKQRWIKASEVEQEYVMDAFSKLDVNDPELLSKDDRRELEAEEEEKEEAQQEVPEEQSVKEEQTSNKLFVDEDDDDEYGDNEEESKLNTFKSASEKNSNLSVGSSNNRSYVARGDKLGVFSSYDEGIAYQTTISNLKDMNGKRMSSSSNKVKYPFWYGGAASMIACLVTHPLDLAKVRLQTASTPGQSLVSMIYQIITKEGLFKIYSGLTASLLRQATYSTARFGIYEFLKEKYVETTNNSKPSTSVLLPMSMVAGALGGLVGNPSDVVNIRMQNDSSLPVEQRRNYRNAFDGIYRVCKDEGISSLFRGLTPNLVRGVLMTASQVVTYDIAKNLLVDQVHMDPAKKSTHFSASLLAGLVATTVCSPADVVKTRIMNDKGSGGSAVQILTSAVKNEGVGFMFRGWLPSFIRLGPHTIVTFLALEQLRKFKLGM